MHRIIAWAIIIAIGSVSIVFLGFYSNPKAITETYLSYKFHRKVTIESLDIQYSPLMITASNLHVANASWGTRPDMLTVEHVSAELTFDSLLGGVKYQKLVIDKAFLFLEHDNDGNANWKNFRFIEFKPSPEQIAMESRESFPTLLDAMVRDSKILFITSSGSELDIDLNHVHLQAESDSQPVIIKAYGAYHSIPIVMDIEAGSYMALYETDKPLPVNIHAKGGTTTFQLAADMMDPLGMDLFKGTLKMTVENVGVAAGLLGEKIKWNVPLFLESVTQRQGPSWSADNIKGAIAGNPFDQSKMHLQEGEPKEPDHLKAEMHFDRVDVTTLLKPNDNQKSNPPQSNVWMFAHSDVGTLLDAKVTAKKLVYRKANASDIVLEATSKPGAKTLNVASMKLWGSTLDASANAKIIENRSNLNIKAKLPDADASQIIPLLLPGDKLKGKISMDLSFKAKGNTTDEYLQTVEGTTRVWMKEGKISRNLVRAASADIRRLFAEDNTQIPVDCMTAQARFINGMGEIYPFRIETAEGNLLGQGTIDLPRHDIDVFFQTDSKTTSSLALDLPIHVTGKLDDPQVVPFAGPNNIVDLEKAYKTDCFAQSETP